MEISAIALSGRDVGIASADLGPLLDASAKRAHRARLHDLQAELDGARADGDTASAARARTEVDELMRELAQAVGIGGRDRPSGSVAERARINVARSLRRAIASIAEQAPLLGRHLDDAVRTGGHCIYLPAGALSWVVQTDRTSAAC